VSRSCHHPGRSAFASDSKILCRLLQRRQNASVTEQRCAGLSPASSDWNHSFTPDTRRASSPLRPGLSFRYTQSRPITPSLWHLADISTVPADARYWGHKRTLIPFDRRARLGSDRPFGSELCQTFRLFLWKNHKALRGQFICRQHRYGCSFDLDIKPPCVRGPDAHQQRAGR
jgi:hypothetical protein